MRRGPVTVEGRHRTWTRTSPALLQPPRSLRGAVLPQRQVAQAVRCLFFADQDTSEASDSTRTLLLHGERAAFFHSATGLSSCCCASFFEWKPVISSAVQAGAINLMDDASWNPSLLAPADVQQLDELRYGPP